MSNRRELLAQSVGCVLVLSMDNHTLRQPASASPPRPDRGAPGDRQGPLDRDRVTLLCRLRGTLEQSKAGTFNAPV